MHGNSNENQRNNIIDRPHLGKTTFSFLFLFFWGGGGGGWGGGEAGRATWPFSNLEKCYLSPFTRIKLFKILVYTSP